MGTPRKRSVDLTGLAVLALALFTLLSLLSYDCSDPVRQPAFPLNRFYQADTLSLPQPEFPQNWCGYTGALLADVLYRSFGWGAYYVLITLFLLAGNLLRQRPIVAPFVQLFGWILSLGSLSSLAATLLARSWTGPMIGPGGYLGALGRGILEQHFATVGSVLVLLCTLTIGVILCTDYVIFQLAAVTAKLAIEQTWGRRRLRTHTHNATETVQPAGLNVRVRGKRATAAKAVEWAYDNDVAVDERDEDVEEGEDEELEVEDEDDSDDDVEEVDEEVEEDAASEEVQVGDPKAKGLRGLIQRASPNLRLGKHKEKDDKKPAPSDERQEVIEQLEEASRQEETREYDLPSIELLTPGDDYSSDQQEKEVRRKARILEKTFLDFGFNVKVVEIETGPVIAQYEIELEAGLRLSKITGLADDLAIALRVPSVRIVAPIPGKNTVGIEVPNEQRQVVRLREVMEEANARVKKMRIPLFLGKDVSGNPLVADLSTLPHLLIAGRTGTGKSVCLNAIISSILMTRRPDEVRMLMIDPKMVELSGYKTLPHLMHPVVTDMRKAEAILAWAVDKMEERYALLARAGVRHISGYNQLGEEELVDRLQPEDELERQGIPLHLPYIVIVADEMADLMMTSGKEVEQHIIRLAQKSRAVGIHLILATQKPTVDVITGLIKSNLPARIAFQVASRTDSRVVLDEMGADKLLGNGDMLFLWPGTSTLLRGQGTYLSDEEINKVVEFVSTGEQDFIKELVQLKVEEPSENLGPANLKKRDDLYEAAVDIVIREGRGSVSLLQRCLGIGYGRAARLIDFMAEDGIVGPYNGSQAREVVISQSDWEAMQAGEPAAEPEPPPPAARRTNRVVPLNAWSGDEPAAGASSTTSPPRKRVPPPPAAERAPADEAEDEDAYEDDDDDDDSPDEVADDEFDEEDVEEDEDTDSEDTDEDEDVGDEGDEEVEAESASGEEIDEYDSDEFESEDYDYEEGEADDEEYEDETDEYEEDDEAFEGDDYDSGEPLTKRV